MYIAIQKLERKRKPPPKVYREYKVIFWGDKYRYEPDDSSGKYERPRRDKYKFTLQMSYREGGQVKKKQAVLFTVNFYDLIYEHFSIYEICGDKIDSVALEFDITPEMLYEMLDSKFDSLRKTLMEEYQQTEEYQAQEKRRLIMEANEEASQKFSKTYHVNPEEYNRCFDVFGNLMDKARFQQIKNRAEYYEQAYSSYHSYFKGWNSQYSGYQEAGGGNDGNMGGHGNTGSRYFEPNHGSYSTEECVMLKKFYKVLAMKFHPDTNPDTDTTREMQLLNKLKEEWNI